MPHFDGFDRFLACLDAIEEISHVIGIVVAACFIRVLDGLRQVDFVRADRGCLQQFGVGLHFSEGEVYPAFCTFEARSTERLTAFL